MHLFFIRCNHIVSNVLAILLLMSVPKLMASAQLLIKPFNISLLLGVPKQSPVYWQELALLLIKTSLLSN